MNSKLSELAMELPGDGLLYIRWHPIFFFSFVVQWLGSDTALIIEKGVDLSSDFGQVR